MGWGSSCAPPKQSILGFFPPQSRSFAQCRPRCGQVPGGHGGPRHGDGSRRGQDPAVPFSDRRAATETRQALSLPKFSLSKFSLEVVLFFETTSRSMKHHANGKGFLYICSELLACPRKGKMDHARSWSGCKELACC